MSRILVWDQGRHGTSVLAAQDDAELEASARDLLVILCDNRRYIYLPDDSPTLTDDQINATRASFADWPKSERGQMEGRLQQILDNSKRHAKYDDMQRRHFAAVQEIKAGTFTGSAWAMLQERDGQREYEDYHLADMHIPEVEDVNV